MQELDGHLRKMSERLNRRGAEKYVAQDDDIGYFKNSWEISAKAQEGVVYSGNYLPSWPSIEGIVTDCYLDLLQRSGDTSLVENRIKSAMLLHDAIMVYLADALQRKKQKPLKDYLQSYDFDKEIMMP